MATNTDGGTTTSFLNSPQAVDDYYGVCEDYIYTFDVMSNDLGGSAKILWSIDDSTLDGTTGTTGSGDGTYDLLSKDAACVPELSDLGARIWIDSGKIRYDARVFNYLGAGETITDHFTYAIRLSNGTLSWATVTIAITGTNDGPTVSAADLAGAVTEDAATPNLTDTGTITFDDVDLTNTHSTGVTAAAGNTLGGTLTASVTDPATGAGDGTVTWNYSVANAATQYLAQGQTATETFTIRISDNSGGYIDQVVVVTVTGTNDMPTVSVADLAGAATEDAASPNLTDTGTITFDDLDLIDTHSTNVTPAAGNTLGGTLTASVTDSATGTGDGTVTWNYSVANSATQYLAQGQTATETFTIRISDNNGGYIDQVVVVTITGANDKPDIRVESGDSASHSFDESNGGLSTSGSLTVTDVDTLDTISTSIGLTTVTGPTGGLTNPQLLGMFSVTPSSGLSANTGDASNLGWAFDSGSQAFNFLRAGETLQLVYTLTVNDGNSGTDTQTVTITVTGTNDAPVLSDTTDPSAVLEAGDASAQNLAAITGNFSVTDLDNGDTLDASVIGGATVLLNGNPFVLPVGASALTAAGAFSVIDTVSNGGAVNIGYSYDPAAANLDFLRAGQSLTITYTVQVNDGTTNSATQDVTFTITGTNDAPILSDTTNPSAVSELADASAQNLSAITGNFSVTDLDVGDTLDASVVGGATVLLNGNPTVLPAGASALTAAGAFSVTDTVSNGGAVNIGYSYDPGAANLDFLAAGQSLTITYTVQVSDGTTTTGTQDVTFTITGTNDAPDIRVGAGDSASDSLSETNAKLTTSGTLTVTDVDTSDQVSTSIALTNVTGNQGSLSDGDLEAMLSVTPDSGLQANTGDANNLTWNFDSDGEAFNYLAPGQSLQLTYTLTVSDGNGGTDTQTVTVTVTGTNDAPVLTGDLAATVAEGGTYQLTTADVNFTDPDDSAANVTFTVTGLSNGTLYVNGIAGNSFTGAQLAAGLVTFTHNGSETTTAGFSIAVEDGNEDVSAPVAQPFNFTVTPVNDAPVNTVPGGQSVNEDQTLVFSTGNGNAISISDADAGSNNVQVALSVASGTLTLGALTGLTVTAGANGTSTVTVQGTLADINAALQGLTYQGNLNFNGGDSLSIVTSDLGNSGSGGALTDSDSVAITINAVNDAPVNNTPASFSTNEDNALKLAGLSVTDVDAGAGGISVTLSVASGTLSAADAGGVTISGSGSGSITLSGTFAAINTYLATVANQPTYTPVANANGPVTLTMTTSDGGNTGSGGAQSDTDNVTITINAVNDAPANTLPATFNTANNTTLKLAGLSVSDVDSAGGSISVTLSVATGMLSASSGGGVTVSGSGTGSMTLSGTVSAISAYLATVASQPVFTPVAGSSGAVILTMTTNDNGNTGAGGALIDTDMSTITVTATNQAPTAVNDVIWVSNNTAVTLSTDVLLGNDTDPDGLALTVTNIVVATGTLGSTVTVNPNGTFSFTTGATGGTVAAPTTVTLTYTVDDGAGGTTTGTVTLRVVGVDTGGSNQDTINLSTQPVGSYQASFISGGAAADTLTDGSGLGTLIGGAAADVLTGNAGDDLLIGGDANDQLVGGGGNDILRGGLGNNDSMDGGTGNEDMLDFSDGTVGITFALDQTAGSHAITNGTGGLGNNDTYQSMEGVIGTNLADTITGSNTANDIIRGGGGNDTLNGAGGTGDLLDLSDATAAVTINFSQGVGQLITASGVGTDTYSNFEGVIGSAFGDTINGSAGNDMLRGGGGNDVIDGGAGNDIITGGTGADTMTGGIGNDTFVFNSPLNAVDTITDFEANGNDHIELSSAIFGAIGVALDAGEFVSNSGGVAGDGNDYILYDTDTGNLYYDADGNGSGQRILIANVTVTAGTIDPTDILIV